MKVVLRLPMTRRKAIPKVSDASLFLDDEAVDNDDDACGGTETGRGGNSLFKMAVGGRERVERFVRSCGTDLELSEDGFDEEEKADEAENGIGSVSSSCKAGKSRMSIEDIESFMPDPPL